MELYIARHINFAFSSEQEMTEHYRSLGINYPKFFKMDALSKMGFLAAEELLQGGDSKEETAVVCFTGAASLQTDIEYQKKIQNKDEFFPSPSVFVYTLPNIVLGEIAIRHGLHAETSCYIMDSADAEMMVKTICRLFADADEVSQVLVAWINQHGRGEVSMALVGRKGNILFCEKALNEIIKH
ncbi:MAG: hypothetical protein NC396_00885 [Bacteroides sp.]|nr:hypothetical protein [Bacteroides sp.]MCM1084877.1 hypothetical protein [Bacteroides sp.]